MTKIVDAIVVGAGLGGLSAATLMASLERAGIPVRSLCRCGTCGGCRTHLRSGDVFIPSWVPLRQADRTYGYIHPCTAYPLADLELEIEVLQGKGQE